MSAVPTVLPHPEINPAWLADVRRQFADRTGLTGLLDARQVPPRYRVQPRATLARVDRNGSAALRAFCERTGVATREDVDVRLFILAVAPELAYLPDALGETGLTGAGSCDPNPRQALIDAQRFAVAVLNYDPGLRLELRPGLRALFPSGWRAVLEALDHVRATVAEWETLRGAAHPYNAVVGLAVFAIGHGQVSPDALPADVSLGAWAQVAHWNFRRLEDLRCGLRAVAALPQLAPYDALCSACPSLAVLVARLAGADLGGRPAALRTLRHVLARKELAGKMVEGAPPGGSDVTPPDPTLLAGLTRGQRAMLEQVARYAPHFSELVLCPRVAPNGREEALRPATVAHVLTAVDHLLAAYIQLQPTLNAAGVTTYPLHELTPEALLAVHVPTHLLTVTPSTLRGRPSLAAGLAQSGFAGAGTASTVPLLQLLFDAQAESSVALSPAGTVAGEGGGAAPPATPRFTQALAKEAADFAHAFDRRLQTATREHAPERAHLAGLLRIAKDVAHHVAAGVGTTGRQYKNPGRLLDLLTLPQLLCVGLPRLGAELHARYRALCAAGRGHRLPPEFTMLLEAYGCTAAVVADTIRQKNLRHARFGYEFVVMWDGHGPERMIVGVHTRFTGKGGENPAASLKMKYEWVPDASGRPRRRERERVQGWPPAVVDGELWRLYLELRTARLPLRERRGGKAGAGVGRPVFLRPKGGGEPMTDDVFRERVAHGLHWVCTQVFGRDLPPWPEFQRLHGRSHYGLFGPHALRALAASYWMGLRGRDVIGAGLSADVRRRLRTAQAARPGRPVLGLTGAAYAVELLNDNAKTLADDYVVTTPAIEALRLVLVTSLPPAERWTHPRAYDAWMDRAVAGDAIVWHRERGLPLPPGCRLRDLTP